MAREGQGYPCLPARYDDDDDIFILMSSSISNNSLNMSNSALFQTIQFFNNVKWFKVLLCIINNSINHQSYIFTQLKVKNSSISNNSVQHKYSF